MSSRKTASGDLFLCLAVATATDLEASSGAETNTDVGGAAIPRPIVARRQLHSTVVTVRMSSPRGSWRALLLPPLARSVARAVCSAIGPPQRTAVRVLCWRTERAACGENVMIGCNSQITSCDDDDLITQPPAPTSMFTLRSTQPGHSICSNRAPRVLQAARGNSSTRFCSFNLVVAWCCVAGGFCCSSAALAPFATFAPV